MSQFWTGCRVLVCVVLVACHKPDPDCDDAIRTLARQVPLGASAEKEATAFCVKTGSAPLRHCLAEAGSEQALQACLANEPSCVDSSKRLDAATRTPAWTIAKQAELDKLLADQGVVMKQMEMAYDAIGDAKTATEADARRDALEALRLKHQEMDPPITAAKAVQAAAQAATDARKALCAENPLLAGCH